MLWGSVYVLAMTDCTSNAHRCLPGSVVVDCISPLLCGWFHVLLYRCLAFAAEHLNDVYCERLVRTMRPQKQGKYEQARAWISTYGRHHGEPLEIKHNTCA